MEKEERILQKEQNIQTTIEKTEKNNDNILGENANKIQKKIQGSNYGNGDQLRLLLKEAGT